eukprot:13349021-Ditylum_brightwellii.AAC.1
MLTQCFLQHHRWGTQLMGRWRQWQRAMWKCGGGRQWCITHCGAESMTLLLSCGVRDSDICLVCRREGSAGSSSSIILSICGMSLCHGPDGLSVLMILVCSCGMAIRLFVWVMPQCLARFFSSHGVTIPRQNTTIYAPFGPVGEIDWRKGDRVTIPYHNFIPCSTASTEFIIGKTKDAAAHCCVKKIPSPLALL